MMNIKDKLKKDISTIYEAVKYSDTTGTNLNKLSKNLKDLLINKLHISSINIETLLFDKHLKNLGIVLKPNYMFNRTNLIHLSSNPDFVDMSNSEGNIMIRFKYNAKVKKRKENIEFEFGDESIKADEIGDVDLEIENIKD